MFDNLLEELSLGLTYERDGATSAPSTGGTADSVDVLDLAVWHVIVDHCFNALDIQT